MPTVKYSVSAYIADGTTTDYLITWDYLDEDHITVEVDGLSNADPTASHTFTKLNDTTVRVTDGIGGAITAGKEIHIRRKTPITTRPISFADGSALLAADLNKNSDYLLFSMQEALDQVDFSVQYQQEAEGFRDATQTLQIAASASEVAAAASQVAAAASEAASATDAATVASNLAAAAASETAAELAETNAETAQSAAETAAALATTNGAAQVTLATTQAALATTNGAAQVTLATTQATNSQVSAVASEVSKVASGLSEVASAASEANASSSEVNAATSAANAATSAANAATSEANSATSEGNAASSATSSDIYRLASAAAQVASETAKTASQTAQTASEAARDAAAASETAAATSETNAAASEASASTDAATATTKAGEASTSSSNAASSASSAQASKDAALAALDSFDDRYLGAKSSAPTVDNDGDALVTGALYWDTISNELFVWSGSAWAQGAFTAGSILSNVVEDTTPQLGGDLASNGNDVLFGANDKALFGTANEFQIYNDGTSSIITSAGGSTEPLKFQRTHTGSFIPTFTFEGVNDSFVGPFISLKHDTASPSNVDFSLISYDSKNDAAEDVTYAQIMFTTSNVADGAEEAQTIFKNKNSGSDKTLLVINGYNADVEIGDDGAVLLANGTTAQRPSTGQNGMLRYNTDDAQFEGYADGAWGAIAGGGGGDTQTVTTTSTTQTALGSYAAATSLGIEITVIATDTVATERTITKLLVTHDGTTAVATQYGEVNTATAVASYDVDISGSNVRLLATAASANSTNFTAVASILA